MARRNAAAGWRECSPRTRGSAWSVTWTPDIREHGKSRSSTISPYRCRRKGMHGEYALRRPQLAKGQRLVERVPLARDAGKHRHPGRAVDIGLDHAGEL